MRVVSPSHKAPLVPLYPQSSVAFCETDVRYSVRDHASPKWECKSLAVACACMHVSASVRRISSGQRSRPFALYLDSVRISINAPATPHF